MLKCGEAEGLSDKSASSHALRRPLNAECGYASSAQGHKKERLKR